MSTLIDGAAGRRSPTRRGGAVVAGAFLSLCVTPMAVTGQTIGLFLGPVTHAFGWSRAAFMLGPSIAGLVCGFVAPFLGWLGDRLGLRSVLLTGIALYGFSIMAMALLNGAAFLYNALSIIVSVAGLSLTSILYAKAISGWFTERRGLMLSIAMSGSGVGAALIPLFVGHLLQTLGWRGAYVGLGLTVIVIAAPAVFFLVREAPQVRDASSSASMPIPSGLSFKQALRTPVYWCLLMLFLLSNAALWSLVTSLAPILTSKGISLSVAAKAMSVLGVSQILARLISGWLLDRVSQARVAMLWYALATGGAVLLGFAQSPQLSLIVGLLIGAAWGAENELAAYFTSRYFGFRAYGLILGTFFAAFSLGGMVLAVWIAHLFDVSGNYDLALHVLAGCLALSCLFAGLLGPYTFARSGAGLCDAVSSPPSA